MNYHSLLEKSTNLYDKQDQSPRSTLRIKPSTITDRRNHREIVSQLITMRSLAWLLMLFSVLFVLFLFFISTSLNQWAMGSVGWFDWFMPHSCKLKNACLPSTTLELSQFSLIEKCLVAGWFLFKFIKLGLDAFFNSLGLLFKLTV